MSSRQLTSILATRIYAKHTDTPVDQVRSAAEFGDGFLIEGESECTWRVAPVEPAFRCHGRDFATFNVRPHSPGAWPIWGVGVTWEDEALYSMASESEFRQLVERVRSSIEAVELASLVTIFRGTVEYHPYHHLVDDAELDALTKYTRPGELERIDGLGPLRISRDSTAMVLDFFSFFIRRGDGPMTTDFVRWHVEIGPPGLSWRSSPVAVLSFEP